MLFVIDMGNTNIVLGCVDGKKVLFEERIATKHTKTELEYAIDFKNLFEVYKINIMDVTGSIISSVVPPLTEVISRAVTKVLDLTPLIVGPGLKNGLKIAIDNPAQLGADLVVGAVAALAEHKPPIAIVDMGTATTISVIDENGRFLGGPIMPGVVTALDSMVTKTSQLPRISFDAPERVIGRNTIESMKSGSVYGNAAMIDGMIDRVEAELGMPVTVIATGGLAGVIIPHCKREIIYDESLLLKGLVVIYEKNRK